MALGEQPFPSRSDRAPARSVTAKLQVAQSKPGLTWLRGPHRLRLPHDVAVSDRYGCSISENRPWNGTPVPMSVPNSSPAAGVATAADASS